MLLLAAGAGAANGGPSSELTVAADVHPTMTTLNCASPVETSHQSNCVATILDTSLDTPTAPEGTVRFESSSTEGSFSAAQCNLTASGLFASCSVNYTPTAVDGGTHHITATYQPSSNHEESSKVADVSVTQGPPVIDPTTTTLNCDSTNVGLGGASTCIVTVEDTSATRATAPSGEVKFATNQAGGFSGKGACNLTQGATGKARCQIAYTPSQVGSSTHTLTASYPGDAGHKKSQGSLQVKVVALVAPASARPNTIIKKKPRRKTAKRSATFGFASDQPGSTFQCKLDKKPFRTCRSPFKAKKLKAGLHTFQVKAINLQGLADPTPATFKWQVKTVSAGARR
jgi:hypothetical protein